MADSLDKLLVKMGLKEERPKNSILLPATGMASGGLTGGILGMLYSNPNDFGKAGKKLWMEEIARNPALIKNLYQASQVKNPKRTFDAVRGMGKMGLKSGLKMAIPLGVLGFGVDMANKAFGTDTYWNQPDDALKKLKGRMK